MAEEQELSLEADSGRTVKDMSAEEDSGSEGTAEAEVDMSNHMRTAKKILEGLGSKGFENMARSGGDVPDMKVLDPGHPLMIKFQKNLKEHLLKLHQETDEQLRELAIAVRDQTKENDELGKHVCVLQKELLQCKASLSKLQKNSSTLKEKKQKLNQKVQVVKNTFISLHDELNKERNNDEKLQKDMEDLALQVVQLKELQAESYADTSTMAHAMEKTSKQKEMLEIDKLRQDMLINRLETDQHNLQDKINLYKSQCAIKQEELSDLRKVLADAVAYIQTIHYEKLQLMQQWNYSISSLEKRDQTCAAMRESVRSREDEMITLKMDIVNHKKYVRKELEQNEKLTLQLLHVDSDIAHIERSIEDCKTRTRTIEENYAFFDKLVMQTDLELARFKSEYEAREKELEMKTKMVEKAYSVQRALEAEYMKQLHEKMTITKATRFTEKLIKEKVKKIEELQTKTVLKEGEKAKLHLKLADSESHLLALEDNLSRLTKDYDVKMKTVSKSEGEISKGHNLLEKKQLALVELNKKLSELISSAGGMELGPLEREIANIKKEIKVSEKSRKTLEQEWLRYQKELVALTNEASAKFKENEMFRRKEVLLEERKIRIDADINHEEKEINELMRSIDRTQNDMSRLTKLLYQEKGLEERLQQEAEMLRGDFLNLMKEAEMNCVKKESEIEHLRRTRAHLLCKLVEAQRQVVLWEEKLQLAEETKKILKSESHAEEVSNIRGEIRRLQVRLEHIRREMEMLMQMMEKAAFKHATLYVQADLQCLRGVKKKSKQYLKTKTERLRKKIGEDRKKLENLKEELDCKNKTMFELKKREEKERSSLSEVTEEIKLMEHGNRNKEREKWQNVIKLSFKHKKNKLLQKVKEEKYVCAIRNTQQRLNEVKKIHDSLSLLNDLIEDILTTHPELQHSLARALDHATVGLQM